jgi:hypothetical protein
VVMPSAGFEVNHQGKPEDGSLGDGARFTSPSPRSLGAGRRDERGGGLSGWLVGNLEVSLKRRRRDASEIEEERGLTRSMLRQYALT